ncbi:MAG: hypothetical protein K8M05_34880, partial [Deltaproteobacteria bacterium]|nr:hypothetical protein [Kofleriaceae bacterium]
AGAGSGARGGGAGRGAVSDVESLSSMLEPDRTGVHDQRGSGRLVLVIAAVLLLIAGVVAGLVLTNSL